MTMSADIGEATHDAQQADSSSNFSQLTGR
jgi:hypothetical protein